MPAHIRCSYSCSRLVDKNTLCCLSWWACYALTCCLAQERDVLLRDPKLWERMENTHRRAVDERLSCVTRNGVFSEEPHLGYFGVRTCIDPCSSMASHSSHEMRWNTLQQQGTRYVSPRAQSLKHIPSSPAQTVCLKVHRLHVHASASAASRCQSREVRAVQLDRCVGADVRVPKHRALGKGRRWWEVDLWHWDHAAKVGMQH
jgi:hypothetical protein